MNTWKRRILRSPIAGSNPRYSTDLTGEQWKMVRPLVKRERHMGRPTTIDLREVVNALLYLNRTGCPWRLLPTDFPNGNTVRYYFDHWTLDGTFIRINDTLCERVRRKGGREPEPSAGIIESQSVKTTEAGGERGFSVQAEGLPEERTSSSRHGTASGGLLSLSGPPECSSAGVPVRYL